MEITKMSRNSLKVALWRLEKIGLICRIGKKWVCIEKCSPEDIVKVAFQPGYISMEWALFKSNVIDQAPYSVTVVWLKPRRRARICGYKFEAHKISEKLFFGCDKNMIAYPEKALLDLIYIRKRFGYTINVEYIDTNRLLEYAKRYPKWVLKSLNILIRE